MKSRMLVCSLLLTALSTALAEQVQPTLTPIQLAGITTYFTYAAKTKEVLQDADFVATAKLTWTGENEFLLELRDWVNGEPRDTVLLGTCTPGGSVQLDYLDPPPEILIWVVGFHAGCTVSGNFPTYFGKFDGRHLLAVTHFNSQCPEYWPNNDIFATPVDGPLHWEWVIDVTVVE